MAAMALPVGDIAKARISSAQAAAKGDKRPTRSMTIGLGLRNGPRRSEKRSSAKANEWLPAKRAAAEGPTLACVVWTGP